MGKRNGIRKHRKGEKICLRGLRTDPKKKTPKRMRRATTTKEEKREIKHRRRAQMGSKIA